MGRHLWYQTKHRQSVLLRKKFLKVPYWDFSCQTTNAQRPGSPRKIVFKKFTWYLRPDIWGAAYNSCKRHSQCNFFSMITDVSSRLVSFSDTCWLFYFLDHWYNLYSHSPPLIYPIEIAFPKTPFLRSFLGILDHYVLVTLGNLATCLHRNRFIISDLKQNIPSCHFNMAGFFSPDFSS